MVLQILAVMVALVLPQQFQARLQITQVVAVVEEPLLLGLEELVGAQMVLDKRREPLVLTVL
jgi:hypothetical protein